MESIDCGFNVDVSMDLFASQETHSTTSFLICAHIHKLSRCSDTFQCFLCSNFQWDQQIESKTAESAREERGAYKTTRNKTTHNLVVGLSKEPLAL